MSNELKNKLIPRHLLKNLAEDIELFIANEPYGWLQALELFDQVPFEWRGAFLEELSRCHKQAMADYFMLLEIEYGSELNGIMRRMERKFDMLGFKRRRLVPEERFFGAYACCTRHSGQICVDLAWGRVGTAKMRVESMLLSFHGDGLLNVLPSEQTLKQFTIERAALHDMIQVNLDEATFLIKQAYLCNQRFVSRPALGRFIYQKYLDYPDSLSPAEQRQLMRRLSGNLTQRQLVNSFFHALRYQDESYIDALLSRDCQWSCASPILQPNAFSNAGVTLLEGRVESVRGSRQQSNVLATMLSLEEEQLYRYNCRFNLVLEDNEWMIQAVSDMSCELLDEEHEDNPLNALVYCYVYTILELDGLFDLLDDIENIREMEELPYGLHMRIEDYQSDFNHGVGFMSGVVADLVINGDEFVVISREAELAVEFMNFFQSRGQHCLVMGGDYQVNLGIVYEYLGGRYISFGELFLADGHQVLFEDGLCLISTRYFLRDREAVLQRLNEMGCVQILKQESYEVYYQLETSDDHLAVLAEYILWPSWMTLSAFGDQELQKIRSVFEANMFEAIEFDGVEIREDGLFDILSQEVRQEYPELEDHLKEVYLNKWYFSHLGVLRGMSPSEACQSEEGTRLLWMMFKRIRQREKRAFVNGDILNIGLKDYLRRTNL